MEEAEVSETGNQEPEVTEATAAEQEPGAAEQKGRAEAEEELGALTEEDLPRAIEAVLFCAGEPVTIRELAELFEFGVHDVRSAVERLREEYIDSGRAFRIEDISGGIQLLTLPDFDPWLRSLHQKRRSSRLSPAALETLAIVAYKGPITKAELESIRGVQCAPTLNTLLGRELIRVAGKAPGLGRPLLYHTTPMFLESFGLGSLKDLPEPETPPSREEREGLEAEKEEEPDASKPAMEAADEAAVQEEAAPFEAAEHDSPPGDEAETGPGVEQEQEPGELES